MWDSYINTIRYFALCNSREPLNGCTASSPIGLLLYSQFRCSHRAQHRSQRSLLKERQRPIEQMNERQGWRDIWRGKRQTDWGRLRGRWQTATLVLPPPFFWKVGVESSVCVCWTHHRFYEALKRFRNLVKTCVFHQSVLPQLGK